MMTPEAIQLLICGNGGRLIPLRPYSAFASVWVDIRDCD